MEMLNLTGNFTNETVELRGSFSYYSVFVTILFLIPATVVNIILFASIVSEKTMPGTIRLILMNIVLAGQLTVIGLMNIFLANIIIVSDLQLMRGSVQPSEVACRIMLTALSTGGAARLLFMATLAVTVYVTVKKGKNKLAFWKAAVASVFVWLIAASICLSILSPNVVDVTFTGSFRSTCSYHGSGPGAFVAAFAYFLVYGVFSFLLTIVFLVLTWVYLKKKTLSQDRRGLRRITLFTLFLLVGNTLNSLGQSIPLIVGAFSPLGQQDYTEQSRILSITEGVLIILSLVPTPILILLYFKNVRKRFFCCCVWLKKHRSPSAQKNANPVILVQAMKFDR